MHTNLKLDSKAQAVVQGWVSILKGLRAHPQSPNKNINTPIFPKHLLSTDASHSTANSK